ncbi:DUF3533 domain-containing protein [Streptomyces roseicoloratus]|uniref:DUF3533 domain-containing protein n=1 Tax=Streptomyces roseicoloratus TaxID=2508722 RepID=A0ABY9RPQ8_9ACTN|nr:DUF3533 domain-containing protein [Streptomyces roseicoloratus]WMX44187.1 DUF3533 domain-containing protein [Streptomyces roseicoloratus]
MRAATVWKHPLAWVLTLLGCVVAAVSTLSYLGPAADPEGHLHGLPVVLVTEDQGASGPTGTVNLGDRVAEEVARTGDDGRVRWQRVATRAEAGRLLDDQEAYAALVVPADFSRSALALLGGPGGAAARRPTLEIAGHTGTAGVAASMADKVLRKAAAQVSLQVGATLTAQAATPGTAQGTGTETGKTQGEGEAHRKATTPGKDDAQGAGTTPGTAPGKATTPGRTPAGVPAAGAPAGAPAPGAARPGARAGAGAGAGAAAPAAGFLALLRDPVGVQETVWSTGGATSAATGAGGATGTTAGGDGTAGGAASGPSRSTSPSRCWSPVWCRRPC